MPHVHARLGQELGWLLGDLQVPGGAAMENISFSPSPDPGSPWVIPNQATAVWLRDITEYPHREKGLGRA